MKCLKQPIFLISSLLIVCCCLCQKKKEGDKIFAKVNGKAIYQKSYEDFTQMRNFYPAFASDQSYPGSRGEPTLCVEVAAIYKQAGSMKSKVKNSLDWTWKKTFFPANMYLINILDKNLGSSDKELEEYYNKNKESYKTTVKVPVPTNPKDTGKAKPADTLKKTVTRDSTFYQPLSDVRGKIARLLFVKRYPPDSAYIALITPQKKDIADTAKKKIAVDTTYIHEQWIMQAQRNVPLFFMKTLYKKRFNKPYPDSLKEVVGKGKFITPEDMDVILNWIPADSRSEYKSPEKQRYLAEWLVKWKLFCDEAENNGYTDVKQIQAMTDWAFKYDVAARYVNEVLKPKAEKAVTVDTEMCTYDHWDRNGKPGEKLDSAALASAVTTARSSKSQILLDKEIYEIRKDAAVTFLQPDFTDDKVENPEKLVKKADSLYAAGSAKEAERVYGKLVDNFPFTPQGLNAMVEYAKVLTENEQYYEAVKNYRRFLMLSSDASRRCNIFFMVGFVYGEYLGKAELAQASYKWILKNSPGCELTDDAEFMCLHLDEPMIGVEELQAEARRQGKKVDEESPMVDSTAVTADTTLNKLSSVAPKK